MYNLRRGIDYIQLTRAGPNRIPSFVPRFHPANKPLRFSRGGKAVPNALSASGDAQAPLVQTPPVDRLRGGIYARTPQRIMTRSQSHVFTKGRRHNKWLVLIAAYKFMQALLFVLIGVGARQLLHKNVGDLLAELAHHLPLQP